MRVLIVSQYFWPENFRINELVQMLQARGVVVEVLTGQPNYPRGIVYDGYRAWGCMRESWQGTAVYRVPLIPRGGSLFQLALNYLSFVVSGIVFGSWLLRGKSFDAIFIFAPSPIFQAVPAIWLGWLKRCPTLLWIQDLWPESLSATGYVTHQGVLKMVGLVVSWIYQKCDLLLVQSKAFIPRVRDIARASPITYFPNFFLTDASVGSNQKVNCPGLEHEFPILFAGNIGSAQAVDVVLDAAALLKNVEAISFIMLGEGTRREWMMQEAAKRGLRNLIFPGQFPIEAMPAIMAQAAVLLVTLADKEIFRLTIPSKIQAYLAAGRPIVACLNGAGADIVNDAEAGIVVPAENASALAEAIRSLHRLPAEKRIAMGANGRRFYEENFSPGKLVVTLVEHINQAVKNYQRKAS